MSSMRERHLQLAMDCAITDEPRARLHRAAAEAHSVAHLSPELAQRAAEVTSLAFDGGNWDEGKHPRGEGGQFGAGGKSEPTNYEDKAKEREGEKRAAHEKSATEHFQKHGTVPPKQMSERQRKENSKAMHDSHTSARGSAASARNEKSKAAYEKAAEHYAEAKGHYEAGDHEKGRRAENLGHYSRRHAELNNE